MALNPIRGPCLPLIYRMLGNIEDSDGDYLGFWIMLVRFRV